MNLREDKQIIVFFSCCSIIISNKKKIEIVTIYVVVTMINLFTL